MNKDIFREYDIRGLADKDLNPKNVELIGKAYGTYLQGKNIKKVVVGRDNRATSEEYQNAITKGLLSTGCDVIDIGLVISPIFYYATVKLEIDGGVMITASHNPKEYNGFKLAYGSGSTIYGEEIQKIYRLIEKGDFARDKGGQVTKKDIVGDYYKMLKEKIDLPKKLKVVIDCGNGTASLFATKALESWGCEVVELYCKSDSNFPNHQPDPVKIEYVQDLIKKVKEEKADLGIGFDGDGDRIGVVDEKGEIIWGDQMMVLFFKEVLEKYPGMDCIIEVKCSQALVDMVKKFGGNPIFYKTGHSLIKAKMKELGTKFTGEMSGHIFFADDHYGYDDAIYAAGRLLRIIAQSGQTMSELLADVPKYYSTPEVRVPTSDEDKFDVVGKAVKYFKENYEVEDIDGARVFFPDGWGLIRASNTQPALVVRAEAKTPEQLEEYKNILEKQLTSHPSVAKIDWSGREG